MNFLVQQVREKEFIGKNDSSIYLTDNSIIMDCKAIATDKTSCKIKIFNVKEDKKLNNTYKQNIDEYNLILHKNSRDSIVLGNQYRFNYSIEEIK